MDEGPLFGRDEEVARLDEALDGLPLGGRTIVVRGDAGIGKTSLIRFAAERAADRGHLVLATTGVESEANLPFAGLHQIIRPILSRTDGLPATQREAVSAAVGLVDGDQPAVYLVGLGVLNLLSELSSEAPVIVTADDAQWLDGPSAEVLTFVGRRLESDPVLLVAAVRDGYPTPFLAAGFPEIALWRLDDENSRRLLALVSPELGTVAHRLVLAAAEGNPLALVELPAALGSAQVDGRADVAEMLPLTDRLRSAFAARAAPLPPGTRVLLTVAAVDDSDDLAEILRAGSRLAANELGLSDVQPAIDANLVSLRRGVLQFRHPLVRHALEEAAAPAEREAAHRALAESLADEPDRRAWHRAASVTGTDAAAAAELETAARRALSRGAPEVALTGFERAAFLTPDDDHRAHRLLAAAELGFELGQPATVGRLVGAAERLGLDQRSRRQAMWLHEAFDDGVPGDAGAVERLVEAALAAAVDNDPELALRLLHAAALRCWWADPGEPARRRVTRAVAALRLTDSDERVVEILGLTAPIDSGAAVSRGAALVAGSPDDSPSVRIVGMAAHTVGDFGRASDLLARAIPALRAQGRLALLAQALVVRAWDAIHLGRFADAARDADEGGRLARETGQPIWTTGASIAIALVAGVRGQTDVSERLTSEADSVLVPARLSNLLCVNQLARGLEALTAGRHSGAFDHLRRMVDPADVAHNAMEQFAAVGYLAEAAAHAGRSGEAAALMPRLEEIGRRTTSPRLHAGLRFARAILAPDGDAEPLFQLALDADSPSPFDGARLRLAYGAWLRRHRRIAESRPHLRAARDSFEGVGLEPWADRARGELRASGERSPDRSTAVRQALSPQELQIAELAAAGLSNREVGERLFLSHRTVGSHLYRIYPKLGIVSRGELRAAMEADGGPYG